MRFLENSDGCSDRRSRTRSARSNEFRSGRQRQELVAQLLPATVAVVRSDAPPHQVSLAAVIARWTRRISWARVGPLAVLVAIVIVALALRFVGLDWGRPFVYHPDEAAMVNPAMNMVQTGSWSPNAVIYPSGLIYVERLIVGILHQMDPAVSLSTDTAGGYAGLPWRSGPNALIEQFPYFYAGRAFVATVGAVMALPTYFAARAVSNTIGGTAAAVAIAVAPLAVANSQYLTTDVPTAALAVLVLWLSLRGLTGGRRWLLAAGFVAGLAASTKYNGGLVVVVPLVVLLTSCPPRQWLRRPTLTTASLIALASTAGFVLLTPAVVLDASQVWTGGILYQLQAYSAHPGAQGTDTAIHNLEVLWGVNTLGFGPGLSILAGLGLLISVVQHRRADLAVLSFVIAYYVVISLPPVRFDRNLLPLMPFLAVLAGRAVGWLVDVMAARLGWITSHLRQVPAIAVGLGVIAMAATPSFSLAVANDRSLLRTDTRTIALAWIEANIPRGATIVRGEFTPQIPNGEYRVGDAGYQLADGPLAWYRVAGVEYVVASSFEFNRYIGIAPQDAFYRSLLAEPIVLDLHPQPGQPGPEVVVVRLRATPSGPGTP
jgi:4-amino-4-deoxy-L-arabinose transferase-like glycosyltransferase